MSLVAGQPKPSNWSYRINGAADEIRGYDAGEERPDYRRTPGATYTPSDEVETLIEIERLTKINN